MKQKAYAQLVFFIVLVISGVLPMVQAITPFGSADIRAAIPLTSGGHGYVHVSNKDPHYFEFDDGTPFVPVGINVATWFNEMMAQQMSLYNMNLARVWMTSWHINIEPQLGVYNESEALKLDYILLLAEQYDVYIQLCLLDFRDYTEGYSTRARWYNNPYSNISGVNEPVDFLTNPTARQYIKKRFNYILDRWGNSNRIAIWEFWNEISVVGEGVGQQATDEISKAWHEDVAQVFRQNDTHKRPLTTSVHGDILWSLTFASDAVDVIQIHTYASMDPALKGQQISTYMKTHLQTYVDGVPWGTDFGNPVMIGEFGELASGERLEILYAGVWAAWASGSGGSSMLWWTYGDLMTEEMYNCYKYFHKFVRDVPWPSLSIGEGTGEVVGASNIKTYSIQGKGFALAWIQNAASGTASGAKLEFRDLSSGDYKINVYNDSSGVYLQQYNVTVSLGNVTVDLPDFTKHLAVKLVGAIPKNVAEWSFDPRVDGEAYVVNASSNSSLTHFSFSRNNKKISFMVTGPLNTTGFCNITVPKALLSAPLGQWIVTIDGEPKTPITSENSDHTFIYLTYSHSNHQIEIKGTDVVPEFPTWTPMLLILFMLTAALATHKRKLLKTPRAQLPLFVLCGVEICAHARFILGF